MITLTVEMTMMRTLTNQNSHEKAQKTEKKGGLEGSRFGPLSAGLAAFLPARVQLENVKAGGSRELPSALLLPTVRRLARRFRYRR
jgi:hypothetical protein